MPATEPNDFFRERRSFTEIKQEILGKYFETWCTLQLTTPETEASKAVLYVDLQAGEGQTSKENLSLPVKAKEHLFKRIVARPSLNEALRTFFYDKSKAVLENIREGMEGLAYYQELIHPPVLLTNSENKASMAELIEAGSSSLIFLDPFSGGYAQEMLLQAVNSWQSELCMLLCPENITKAVAGKKVSKPLVALFGERLQKISTYSRKEKDKQKQQEFILDHFVQLLQEKGNFTVVLKINMPDLEQPYSYLLFSSPDGNAYRNFKEALLPYSTCQQDGVPLFVANEFLQPQLSLFEQRPAFTIPNLVERLTAQAALYKYKSIEKIYEMDSCNTNYSRENYVAAFEQLRKEGKIELLNAKTMQTIRQPTPASVVKYRL